jgi:hypothetical protein
MYLRGGGQEGVDPARRDEAEGVLHFPKGENAPSRGVHDFADCRSLLLLSEGAKVRPVRDMVHHVRERERDDGPYHWSGR